MQVAGRARGSPKRYQPKERAGGENENGSGSGKDEEASRQGKGGRPQGPQPHIHAAPAPTRETEHFVRLVHIGRARGSPKTHQPKRKGEGEGENVGGLA